MAHSATPPFRHSAILVASLLAACHPDSRATGPITAIDDAGDTVRLAAPAQRVVSLIPATTELLFAIGAGPAVVGRTAWCDYPAAALAVPNLGDGIRPNLEAILAQHPDLVVLYRSAQNAEVAERLHTLGIPSVRVAIDQLADVSRVAHLLGGLTGRAVAADSLEHAFDSALAASSAPSAAAAPKTLILVWDQPPMTIGRGSFLSELVERAGGKNLFGDIASSSAPVSVEAVVARDPDLIVYLGDDVPGFTTRPEWQGVRAVREHRWLRISGSIFSRPSPRADQAVRELAARFRGLAR